MLRRSIVVYADCAFAITTMRVLELAQTEEQLSSVGASGHDTVTGATAKTIGVPVSPRSEVKQ